MSQSRSIVRLAIPHVRDGTRATFGAPVRPDVGASRPAGGADAALLDVAQPEIVRPGVGADRDVMAAMAPDQDASNAGGAHLGEGDLDRAAEMSGAMASRTRHAPSKPVSMGAANYRLVGALIGGELLLVVGVNKCRRRQPPRPPILLTLRPAQGALSGRKCLKVQPLDFHAMALGSAIIRLWMAGAKTSVPHEPPCPSPPTNVLLEPVAGP